jgi:hypothetical protein
VDLPDIPWITLAVIALLAGLTGLSLRIVAGRWWEVELILTSSLTQLPPAEKKSQTAAGPSSAVSQPTDSK